MKTPVISLRNVIPDREEGTEGEDVDIRVVPVDCRANSFREVLMKQSSLSLFESIIHSSWFIKTLLLLVISC